MAKYTINEDELVTIVEQVISKTITENSENEGMIDNIKSAWKGLKQGYQTQNALDKNNDTDYKVQNVSKYDERYDSSKEDVISSIKKYYALSKDYFIKSNQLRNKANQLAKKYGVNLAGNGFDKNVEYNQ